MILVTLGTQDKSFDRLLFAIEKAISSGFIKDKVIVQAGLTKFKSDYMEIFDFIQIEKFDDLINECDILITHGGVGSILAGIKAGKKVIAAPRLKKYNEHTNDHQLELISAFAEKGYIVPLYEFDDLEKVLKEVEVFQPKKFISNTSNIINLIKNYIDSDK